MASAELLCSLWEHHPPSASMCSAAWKLFQFHSLGLFMEASLHGHACVHAKSLQSCLTLCDPMNRSTPGLPATLQHCVPQEGEGQARAAGGLLGWWSWAVCVCVCVCVGGLLAGHPSSFLGTESPSGPWAALPPGPEALLGSLAQGAAEGGTSRQGQACPPPGHPGFRRNLTSGDVEPPPSG